MAEIEKAIKQLQLHRIDESRPIEKATCEYIIRVLCEKRSGSNSAPMTREQLEREFEEWRRSKKERWLWGVDLPSGAGEWFRISSIANYANMTTYGKTWATYFQQPASK